MKYAVDRIEEKYAILQNLDTGEMLETKLEDIGIEIKEGDILIFKENKFTLDMDEKEARIKRIQEKMNRLKKEEK